MFVDELVFTDSVRLSLSWFGLVSFCLKNGLWC